MSESKLVPETWIITKFYNICEIISGKNQQHVIDENGEFPIYGSGGIIGYANDYLCDEGTTIIGRKGTINSPIFVKQKFWNVDTAFGLNPYFGYHKSLFNYYCQAFNFKKLDKSTTIPSLAKTDLLEIEIPLPPLNEQHRIVSKIEELFSDLDNGIANLKLAQNQLKVYRQALLKAAFEGKLTEQWRKENNPEPAEKLLERIKEERKNRYEQELKDWKEAVKVWEKEGKKDRRPTTPSKPKIYNQLINIDIEKYSFIPKKWKWSRIGECVFKVGDIDHKMPKDKLNGIPYLSTRDIKADGTLNFEDVKTISEEDYTSLSNKIKPMCNDIIFPRYGTIGRNVLINTDKKFLVSYSCAIIKTIPKLINEKYLYLYTLSPIIKSEIERYVVQTTQANIGISSIENFVIPLCPLEEQHLIVAELEQLLSQIDNMESAIKSAIQKSESLRQSILKKAFEGKLVAQDPNDEPAEELLKRIQAEKKKYLEEQKEMLKKSKKVARNTKAM